MCLYFLGVHKKTKKKTYPWSKALVFYSKGKNKKNVV